MRHGAKKRLAVVMPPSEQLGDDRVFVYIGPVQIATVARDVGGWDVEVADLTGHARRCAAQKRMRDDGGAEAARGSLVGAVSEQHFEYHDAPECAAEVWENAEREIAALRDPDVVGVYALSCQVHAAVKILDLVRRHHPRAKTVLGGPHVAMAPEAAATLGFDHVVADLGGGGGGEAPFLRLLARLERGLYAEKIVRAKPNEAALHRWPWADRGLIDVDSYRYIMKGERAATIVSQRGCSYASFGARCLIALPDRMVRFDDLEYSDTRTLSCSDAAHHHRLCRTDERVVSQGVRPTLCISLSNGCEVDVTPDHTMLRVDVDAAELREVQAGNLRCGDWLPVEVGQNRAEDLRWLPPPPPPPVYPGSGKPRTREVRIPTQMTEELAWFVGCFIGDGCLPADGRGQLHVAVKDRTRERLVSAVNNLFGIPLRIHLASNTQKMQHGWIGSRRVVDFIRYSVGVEPGEAKTRVPAAILYSPTRVVRAFLAGLWAADGYWPQRANANPYLTTLSRTLAHETAALIHWIGDAAVIRKIATSANSKARRPWLYRVEWADRTRRDQRRGLAAVHLRVPVPFALQRRNGRLHRVEGVTTQARRDMLREAAPGYSLLRDDRYYVQVVSVASAGEQPVYDVHHHPSHRVGANGTYVRQCSFCSHTEFYRRVDFRDPSHVEAELNELRSRFGYRAVQAYDDETNLNRRHFEALCDVFQRGEWLWRGFIKSNLFDEAQARRAAESGAVQLCTGVESADDVMKRHIAKKSTIDDDTRFVQLCLAHGIAPKTFSIIGLAGESDETAAKLEAWLLARIEDGLVDFDVTVNTPYPGTKPYDDLMATGVYVATPEHGLRLVTRPDFAGSTIHYKTRPGTYQSLVETFDPRTGETLLSAAQLVAWRDRIDRTCRAAVAKRQASSATSNREEG